MGFFTELKEDLSQAVNELMADEEMIQTQNDMEVSEQELEQPQMVVPEASNNNKLAVETLEIDGDSYQNMLNNIDAIEIPMEDVLSSLDETSMMSEGEGDAEEKSKEDLDLEALLAETLQMLDEAESAEESPIAEEAPIIEEMKVAEEASVIEEMKVAEEAPIIEEMKVAEEAPVIEEMKVAEEAPVIEEMKVVEEVPVIEEIPITVKDTVVDENNTIEENFIIGESSIIEENPVIEEVSFVSDALTMENMEEQKEEDSAMAETEEMTAVMEQQSNDRKEAQIKMDEYRNNRTLTDDVATIPTGMMITGELVSNGSVDICGTVYGNVDVLGKLNVTGSINGNSCASEIYAEGAKVNGELRSTGAVKIGNGTVVIGNVAGSSAAVAGAVQGDIDINGPVILDSSAIVVGNIKAKSVQINNGAIIEGMCSLCYAEVSPASFFDEYKNK